MKKFLFFPAATCLILAFINIFSGQEFTGSLWLIATFIFSVTFLPIIFNMDDKVVPVLQIFSALIFFSMFFVFVAFFDFKQSGFPLDKALVYGLGVGLGTIAILMLRKE